MALVRLCECDSSEVCVTVNSSARIRPPALRLSHAEAMRRTSQVASTAADNVNVTHSAHPVGTGLMCCPDNKHTTLMWMGLIACLARLRLPAVQLGQQDSAGQSPFPSKNQPTLAIVLCLPLVRHTSLTALSLVGCSQPHNPPAQLPALPPNRHLLQHTPLLASHNN